MCGEGGPCVAREHDRGCAWWGEHVWQGGMRAGETATEASGTHPIGMHSCSLNVFFDVFD